MSSDQQLHELDPTGRFTDRAADYVRYRPGYPAAAIDAILDGLGPVAAVRAADIGAGTGISARLLGGRGVRVFAVEPNEQMRAAAAPHPFVEWVAATAEATGLRASSVDLVLCAQAFHWFRPVEAIAEFARILRPGGRLALMWNERDRADPLAAGYTQAIRDIGGEHPAEMRDVDPTSAIATGPFGPSREVVYGNAQRLDRAGLMGRATSASYVPKEGPRLAELANALDALYERYRDPEGLVTFRYRTRIWLAERM
jgi:SAM-dependent methyltransferase